MKNLDLKKIVIVAVLIALFFVLSIFGTINFGSVKITVQNLPIYIAAIEFGPIYGLLVGSIGILLNQIVVYGFMPTTIIWIIPHLVFGYVCGIVYKNEKFRVLQGLRFWIVTILLNVFLTLLNTFSYIIDSLICGYFSLYIVLGSFIIRIMTCFISGIVYSILIPIIDKHIKK